MQFTIESTSDETYTIDESGVEQTKTDPNAPKWPMTPYDMWKSENMEQLKGDNPKLRRRYLLKLAEEWQDLDSDKKAVSQEVYLLRGNLLLE